MSSVYAPEKANNVVDTCSGFAIGNADGSSEYAADSSTVTKRQSWLDSKCIFRKAVLSRLKSLSEGRLTVTDSSGTYSFGNVGTDVSSSADIAGTIQVHDRKFYRALALGGALGAAESYIQGQWDSPDLQLVMQVFARNFAVLTDVDESSARILRPLRAAGNWLKRNTKTGSKRNISAHYDLSNDFFQLMLDPTMTYSSGVFPTPESTMEEASTEKYDRICRKLKLQPSDHVVEIGTGWGGFAEHAVTNYGCKVTTTTISDEQHAFAAERFRTKGIDSRITLLKDDYRDLKGQFDKLVSIEMIEAVGKKFLPGYFAKCSQLLKPEGMMALQAITIPDHRFDYYCRSVDFIQRYIFPGGFLPSVGAMASAVAKNTDFRFFHIEDFGPHYAETLMHWRRSFWDKIDAVKELGFDERFIRTWEYYLCYCEAGFRERQVGVSQLVLTKPAARAEPILSVG